MKALSFQIGSEWNLTGLFLKQIRIDWRISILRWRRAFKMAAMTSFHAEKCSNLVSAHVAFGRRICSSDRQFLIHSRFALVVNREAKRWPGGHYIRQEASFPCIALAKLVPIRSVRLEYRAKFEATPKMGSPWDLGLPLAQSRIWEGVHIHTFWVGCRSLLHCLNLFLTVLNHYKQMIN